MERYIQQLIEDISEISKNTKSTKKAFEKIDGKNEFDEANIDEYLYGERIKIADITGISTMLLPPPKKLTKKQQAILSVELEKLLQEFHFELDFPINYPNKLRYPFIYKFWDEKYTNISFGTSHIEFCNYDLENCPFPKHCTSCKDWEKDWEQDKNQKDKT